MLSSMRFCSAASGKSAAGSVAAYSKAEIKVPVKVFNTATRPGIVLPQLKPKIVEF